MAFSHPTPSCARRSCRRNPNHTRRPHFRQDAAEYALQRDGDIAAFNDASIRANILSFAAAGGIAVNVIHFSQDAAEAVGWKQLSTLDLSSCSSVGPCPGVQMVRDAAAGLCITTNGLAIEDGTYGVSGLIDWYNENVRTADGFVITANNFADFERAAIATIGREISNVPEPASLALVGSGSGWLWLALGLRVVGGPEGSPTAPACRPLQSGQFVCMCSGC